MSRPCYQTVLLALLLAGSAAGQQAATTVQLPEFGIAIDADGVLSSKAYPDPDRRLFARRIAAAKDELPGDLLAASDMRMISLVKLERAIRARVDAGEEPDDAMRHLAGLQRVQFVFFYPERRDIVVAGPAEGWVEDASGRAVGMTTRRPVLLLEDLTVALRAFPPRSRNNPYIGCSIDPDPAGLARLQQFQATVPRSVPQQQRDLYAAKIVEGTREAIGRSNIRIFGVPPTTHFAQVLIEADYRMKLIGVGLEPPPVKMATFIGSLSGARHAVLNRWWFTPNYDCVKVTADGFAMELVGQGVELHGEDKTFTADGGFIDTGIKQNKASEMFTTSFTKKYPEIAANSPVYGQLRNMIDLAVAAAFIRQQDYYTQADWALGVLANEAALPVETLANPRQTDCAVNAVWKGNRFFAPASGGVSISPDKALEKDRVIADRDGQLADRYQQLADNPAPERWWWD